MHQETYFSGGTRARILHAAQGLFAEHGFAGMSLRQLSQKAQVNLAAINYHFGSKEKLIREALWERIEPINRERLRLLEKARTEAGDTPLSLDAIMDALLVPFLEAARTPEGPDIVLMQMVGRSFSESSEVWQAMLYDFFQELWARFMSALEEALPELSQTELSWRFHLVICMMLGTLAQHHRLEYFSQGQCDASDIDAMLAHLKNFAQAGLSAPAVEQREQKN